MSDRDRFRGLMLEHLYGLLDADEARELEVYLATPDGAGLRAEAVAVQTKLASAARRPFPDVRFQPPADEPVRPNSETPILTVRRVWMQWAVAACLLVVFGGLGLPAAYQFIGWSAQSVETEDRRVAMNKSRSDLQSIEAESRERQQRIKAEHERAVAAEKEAEKAYQNALATAKAAAEQKDFQVRLTGPERAIPGAPNEWRVETLNKQGGSALPRKLELVVKDQKDSELLHETFDRPLASPTLKLPTSFWQKVNPRTDLFLEVVAYTDDNRKSVLAERVPLARPVYVTHLVTDKPMYRPGEVVRYRSLTLDRSTFLPPDRDLDLEYRLRTPDGFPIPLGTGNGRLVRGLDPVVGPDGKPLRGIGTGEYELPTSLPGGEYTLEVVEKGSGPNSPVLDRRRFLVNHYVPDTLEKSLEFAGKSFGPNEVVQARVGVSRTAGGSIQAPKAVSVTATVNGKTIYSQRGVAFDVQPDPATKQPCGILNVRFPLPADLNANRQKGRPLVASLAVAIRDGDVTETIIRPIPLIDGGIEVEFFPEGGDLVAGVPGRVYFQARTPTGKPADLKGTITDGTNDVAEVATLTDADQPGVSRGLGVFTFTPQAGKKYFLKLQTPAGITGPTKDGFPLPEVKPDGVVLTALDRVTEKGKPIGVRLQAAQAKVLHVGAYARGRLIGHQRVELAAGKPVEVYLTGDDAAGGVTRVTVFEEVAGAGQRANLVPRAERLVFRQPGEYLRFGVTPDKDKYSPAGQVALDIAAQNESGQPAPAILMVGVINQSVVAMADSKTDRLPPTHFLLAGDVRDPSELEYADFLLTDHPKAGEALDLLLGTQGWRRFAEQDGPPANPRDAQAIERMMVARGRPADRSIELDKLQAQRIATEFRPKLEQVATRRVNADDALDRFHKVEEPAFNSRVQAARASVSKAEQDYDESAAELFKFETRAERIRGWAMPLFLLGLLGLVTGGAALALHRSSRERRRYVLGAVAAGALGVLVLGGIVLTRGTNDAQRAYAKVESDQRKSPPMGLPAPNPDVIAKGPDAHDMQPVKGDFKGPDAMASRGIRTLRDAEERDRLADIARATAGRPPVSHEPPTEAAEVERERRILDRVVEIINKASPADPRVPAAEPAPPSVVREYAHIRNPNADAVGGDHAETVYWNPVLVLPDAGRTRVEFQLSDDVGRYRVLVAGHTTDGRLGATVKMIESQK